MKTINTLTGLQAFAAIAILSSATTSGQIPSATPVGSLTANPTVVQTGTKPTLTWDILYPSNVGPTGSVTINPPGSLITNSTVYATVQLVGNTVSSCNPTLNQTTLNTDARISLNGGAYKQLFYGTPSDVNPAKNLYIKKILKNQTLDFGGRFVNNGGWSSFYTTRNSNFQVIALKNGDSIPASNSVIRESYLNPYLDAQGKIKIGPMSVLIMMELGQTNHSMNCFNYQDQILLVTFSSKHPNNGHGNNLDGVDSSNPGQGSGGPNGQVDPSGGVDDEIR
jgi:hypothetical protein